MTKLVERIKRHPVMFFYVLTFAISWGAILLTIGPAGILGTEQIPEDAMTMVYMATLLGPSVAGLISIGLCDGRPGFRELWMRLRTWRVGIGWYALAILTAPVLILATVFVLSLTSPNFIPTISAAQDVSAVLITGIVAGLMVGIFEELGWTGFAIPRLRLHHGVLATGLIVGLLWGLWHGPLFVADVRSAVGIPPAIDLAVRLFSFLPAFRVLMVEVYDQTRSLLLAMLMHASLTGSTLILQPQVSGMDVMKYDLLLAAALWLMVAIFAARRRRPGPR